MKCDVVVLETGLGGNEDATNVVKNTVIAAFATISRDHMGFLGNTLTEIAEKKAGIIKPGCVVVSAPQQPEVRDVLEREAQKYGCPVIYAEPKKIEIREESYQGQTFSYKEMNEIRIQLAGRYQLVNAATAYEVMQAWNGIFAKKNSERAIRIGFAHTEWVGRFTCIAEQPTFVVDGAHNEDAARRLRESVETYFPGKKLTYIMGVFKDKEYEKIVDLMIPYAECVYTIDLPDEGRSLPAEELKDVIQKAGAGKVKTEAVGDIEKAVSLAMEHAGEDGVILAFGSLSYLGKVIETVNR